MLFLLRFSMRAFSLTKNNIPLTFLEILILTINWGVARHFLEGGSKSSNMLATMVGR